MIMGIILIIGAGAGAALGSSPIFFFSGQLWLGIVLILFTIAMPFIFFFSSMIKWVLRIVKWIVKIATKVLSIITWPFRKIFGGGKKKKAKKAAKAEKE
jgi:hypothetical protein